MHIHAGSTTRIGMSTRFECTITRERRAGVAPKETIDPAHFAYMSSLKSGVCCLQRACADFLIMLGMPAAIDGAVKTEPASQNALGFYQSALLVFMLITRASQICSWWLDKMPY